MLSRRTLLTAAGAVAAAPVLLHGQEEFHAKNYSPSMGRTALQGMTQVFNGLMENSKNSSLFMTSFALLRLANEHLEDIGFHAHIEHHWAHYNVPPPPTYLESIPGLNMSSGQKGAFADRFARLQPFPSSWHKALRMSEHVIQLAATIAGSEQAHKAALWVIQGKDVTPPIIKVQTQCDPNNAMPCPTDLNNIASGAGAAAGALGGAGYLIGLDVGSAVAEDTAVLLGTIGALMGITAGVALLAAYLIVNYGGGGGQAPEAADLPNLAQVPLF